MKFKLPAFIAFGVFAAWILVVTTYAARVQKENAEGKGPVVFDGASCSSSSSSGGNND